MFYLYKFMMMNIKECVITAVYNAVMSVETSVGIIYNIEIQNNSISFK